MTEMAQETDFSAVLKAAGGRLSQGTRNALEPLLESDLGRRFASRLELLAGRGGKEERPEPHFHEETTPPAEDSFRHFAHVLKRWQKTRQISDQLLDELADALERTSLFAILHLLGKRTTPGSVADRRAFPPGAPQLLAAADTAVNLQSRLSVAARALAKHAGRSEDPFWKVPSGGEPEQNQTAKRLLEQLLDNYTWWNVFTHFQHGLVYEVRVAAGHGARWSHDGARFIGFVDPFDRQQRSDAAESAATAAADDQDAQGGAAVEGVQEAKKTDLGPLPERLDRAELLRRWEAGQRQFHDADLTGCDLHGLDLRGIDLTRATLCRAKLFDTNFEGATLTECNLSETYLAGTRLSGASMRRANLRGCRMDGVRWHGLDLDRARLDSANLAHSQFTECRLRNAGLGDADLTGARWIQVRAYGVYLERASLKGAFLQDCRFNNARLAKAEFQEARFDRCRFESADLSHATCTGARFNRCELTDAEFANADLSQASLAGANFDRAKLSGAKLVRCDLRGAECPRANLSRANLTRANLHGCRLSQADLSRADLRDADLRGAQLDGADLSSADVVNTQVDDATNFEAAKTIGVDFGTNWSLRQRVLESAHHLTIRHFCRRHPVLGFAWWLMLGYGKRSYLLLLWGVAIVLLFAGLMAWQPRSFDFGQTEPTFWDHCRNSLAVFVTLDLAVDKGTDDYGRGVMLVQMLLSYLMLGFMASLFSGIFPSPPE